MCAASICKTALCPPKESLFSFAQFKTTHITYSAVKKAPTHKKKAEKCPMNACRYAAYVRVSPVAERNRSDGR